MVTKLMRHCLKEARKRKRWAEKTKSDRGWLRRASDMSKDMLRERLAKPVEQLAREKCDYLKLRACAKGRVWGSETWIDRPARDEYKRATGRFPICRRG